MTGTSCIWAAARRAARGWSTMEAAAVLPEGRISPDDLGIWKDEHIPTLDELRTFCTGRVRARNATGPRRAERKHEERPLGEMVLVRPAEGGWHRWRRARLLSAPNYADASCARSGRDRRGCRRFSQCGERASWRPDSTLSRSMPRTATCCTNFSRRFRISAPTPTAAASRTARGSDRSRGCRARRMAGPFAAVRAHLGHGLGRRRLEHRRIRRAGRAAARARGRPGGLLFRRLVADAKIPLAPGYQVGFAAPHPARGGHCDGAVGMITEPEQANEIIRTARRTWCFWRARCCAIPTGRSCLAALGQSCQLAEAVFARRSGRLTGAK